MKVCTCLVLFRIFAHTNLISGIKPKDLRSAYLKEDEVLGVTEHLKNVTNNKNNTAKYGFRVKTFTEFIVEAVKVLNTYGDTAFEHFFNILDTEMSNYHYRGGKFSELMKNDDSKQLLSLTFNMIREKPVSETRDNINALADSIRDETNDDNVRELLDYVNTLYTNAEEKFQNVLVDLKHYRNSKSIRTHIKLQKLIRYAVRTILFDHYSKLDNEIRQELQEKLQAFWESEKKTTASGEFNNPPAVRLGANKVNDVEKFMNTYVGPDVLSKKTTILAESSSSEETGAESSQDKTTATKSEKTEESSEESEKPTQNSTATLELLSGQSLDSSSNSIKKSQERHELFNTQRYMTLYTEEIRTTKKTKFVLRASNATNTRVKRQPSIKTGKDISDQFLKEKLKTLTAMRDKDSESQLDISVNSKQDSDSGLSLEMNVQLRAKQNPGKQLNRGKPNIEPRFVANGENSEIFIQDTIKPTYFLEPVIQTKAKAILYPRTKEEQAKPRPQTLLPLRKSSSRYLEPYASISRTNDLKKKVIEPHFPDEGHSEERFTDKHQTFKYPSRRSGNDSNIGNKNFNQYVIKRLDALEKELKELKQRNRVKIETRNDTNDKIDTTKGLMDTVPLSAVNEKEVNVTVTDTATNDTASNTTVADEKVTTNDTTATVNPIDVENATFLESVATKATVAKTRAYPDYDPAYYEQQHADHAGFFENLNQGLDLRMR